MSYALSIRPTAQRQFARLSTNARTAVAAALEGLAVDPRPHNHIKLSGSSDSYRVRVGWQVRTAQARGFTNGCTSAVMQTTETVRC